MNVTKAWVTEGDAGLVNLSINTVIDETKPYMKPLCHTLTFPEHPDTDHPKQQTITIGLFDEEDLWKIKKALDKLLLGLTFDE